MASVRPIYISPWLFKVRSDAWNNSDNTISLCEEFEYYLPKEAIIAGKAKVLIFDKKIKGAEYLGDLRVTISFRDGDYVDTITDIQSMAAPNNDILENVMIQVEAKYARIAKKTKLTTTTNMSLTRRFKVRGWTYLLNNVPLYFKIQTTSKRRGRKPR